MNPINTDTQTNKESYLSKEYIISSITHNIPPNKNTITDNLSIDSTDSFEIKRSYKNINEVGENILKI